MANTPNIDKILDNIEAQLNKLKANKGHLEYWEDHGDGGFWRPLTEEKAAKFANDTWNLDELRLTVWFLVKTDTGIRILNKEEYETCMDKAQVLYQGTYQACKNFIKV